MKAGSRLKHFDPRRVAHAEMENYVAYYQKRWLKLLRVSVALVRETYGLSLPQAIYGAYLIARAEIAYAPFPENDRPRAEAYMRQFFTLVKKVHGLQYEPQHMAQVNINWWDVHRRLFGQAENEALVDALERDYALFYGLEPERFRQAAEQRAHGMLLSDLWVHSERQAGSPLLVQEEEALYQGYTALRQALLEAGLAARRPDSDLQFSS